MLTILYIHGMGGGADSRIPKILSEALRGEAEIVIRTYDFDPEKGAAQIASWVDEVHPGLVIGESLGAIQAMRVRGVPHLYVSPSLGAPARLGLLSALSLIPGMRFLFNRIWTPREGDRQALDFRFSILRKYPSHGRKALQNTPLLSVPSDDSRGIRTFRALFARTHHAQEGDMYASAECDEAYAYFGTRDHYRRSGVVSIRAWRKYFGEGTYTLYDGTHFMEEEYIHSLLIPKILSVMQKYL